MIVFESDVQKQILEYLAWKHIFVWRQNSGATVYEDKNGNQRFVRYASINGISDIMGILPDGRLLAIEVKRVGKKPSDDQKKFLAAIKKNNGVAILAYSLDDVKNHPQIRLVSSNRETTSSPAIISRGKNKLPIRIFSKKSIG